MIRFPRPHPPPDRPIARLTLAVCFCAVRLCGGPTATPAQQPEEARPPKLTPDYVQIVVPPNIAPLNVHVDEPGTGYRVTWRSTRGEPLTVVSRSPSLCLPLSAWQRLLRANAGEPLFCQVEVREATGQWRRFQTVTNHIAPEPVDRTLVYRLLKPLYSLYVHMGIYQRDLESFDERPVLPNQLLGGGCLNCHTFLNHQPDTFLFHTRGDTNPQPTVLVRANEPVRVNKTLGYPAWHPSGRLLAFSVNKLSQFYHTRGETRDVFDARSDLGILRLDQSTFAHPTAIAQTNQNETWPAWSPDGRFLYYCRAAPRPVDEFKQIRYDLMRVAYDAEQDRWGEPQVLLAAERSGASAGQPQVSPDGRFLLFTLSRYGNFPIYQPSSDLFVLDLASGEARRPDINSPQADTWHCWSSNSRWVVFSSKRLDGLFARPFFSYVDAAGRFHKPFVLPQADPAFYGSYLKTFNVPQLVRGPITISPRTLARTIHRPWNVLAPKPSDAGVPARPAQADSSTEGDVYRAPRR